MTLSRVLGCTLVTKVMLQAIRNTGSYNRIRDLCTFKGAQKVQL